VHALLEPDLGGESELSLRPLGGREHLATRRTLDGSLVRKSRFTAQL
jgi:hypothetical protein